MKIVKFNVTGMHCGGCKLAVEKALKKISGVVSASANPNTGDTELQMDDLAVIDVDGPLFRDQVSAALHDAGYSLGVWGDKRPSKLPTAFIWGTMILLFAAVIWFSPIALPAIGQIPESVGLGALFLLGLVTSIHCIGMCGGINLSVTLTTKMAAWRASAAYNLGRIFSYTLVGAILGAIGGTFNLSMTAKGLIAIAAGLLMVLMALKQLGWLNGFALPNFIPTKWFTRIQSRIKPGSMPFIVGVVNALMPCGPLQAMQLYALSTGSWWLGALGMFVFALGTVPLMFTFGLTAATLGKRFNKPLKVGSAVLLLMLALLSLQRGLILASPAFLGSQQTEDPVGDTQVDKDIPNGAVAVMNGDFQEVTVVVSPQGYQDIVLAVNIPAKVTFVASDRALTSCNEAIIMPDFEVQVGLSPGETTVTFTPTEVGAFNYSCWMGMLNNTVHVLESLPNP